MRNFLRIADLTVREIKALMGAATYFEAHPTYTRRILGGVKIANIFCKPSLRTKGAFLGAAAECGADAHYFAPEEVGLGGRESAPDVARTLKALRYNLIAARVFGHEVLTEMAEASGLPVVNLLSNDDHPSQALADALTIQRCFQEKLKGLTVAYFGDGNNVAASLAQVMLALGANVVVATPALHRLSPSARAAAVAFAKESGTEFLETSSAQEAARGAHVLYTDVWASMHQKEDKARRNEVFSSFQLNSGLVEQADPNCIVMHCLPAERGLEVTSDVIDGPRSVVWEQAGDRLVAARAILAWVLGKGEKAFN